MRIGTERLLLDTHVWIWLNEGASQLNARVTEQIDRAAARGDAFVSVMSAWEVSMLHTKQRVVLRLDLPTWVELALAPPITVAGLTPEIAVGCHRLPDRLNNDPIDRILVATARNQGLTLLTRDRAILDYAAQGHVRALPC